VRRVDPFAKRFALTAPPAISYANPIVAQPRADAIVAAAPKPNARIEVAPTAPHPSSVAPVVAPSIEIRGNASLRIVTVRPGDSLWKLAQENLGRGSRWQELLAANPGIVDPARIAAGTEIVLPTNRTGMKTDMRVTVKQGDTLTQIAKLTYGRAAAWRCIEQANPEISDANHIYAGQQLRLPFACRP
jgi:nucleoid-associated protein YgaU